MVCVRWGEGGPFYSPNRSVPSLNKYGNIEHRLGVDKNNVPAKMLLEGLPGGVGRPPFATSRHRLRLGRLQVGPLVRYVGAGAWLVGLLCHVGLFCK